MLRSMMTGSAERCPTLTNMLVIIVGGIPIAMPTVLSVTLALGAAKLAKVPTCSLFAVVSNLTCSHRIAAADWLLRIVLRSNVISSMSILSGWVSIRHVAVRLDFAQLVDESVGLRVAGSLLYVTPPVQWSLEIRMCSVA